MKKAILFISILFTSIINGYGQKNELLLRSKVTGEETVIDDGKYLKVVCKNGLVFRGIPDLTDTSLFSSDTVILIGTDKIRINEIEAIKLTSLSKIPIGSTMTGAGVCLAIVGYFRYSNVPLGIWPPSFAGLGTIIIAVPLTIVGVVILISGKKYKSLDWYISIRAKKYLTPLADDIYY
jgi:hypothetical protein